MASSIIVTFPKSDIKCMHRYDDTINMERDCTITLKDGALSSIPQSEPLPDSVSVDLQERLKLSEKDNTSVWRGTMNTNIPVVAKLSARYGPKIWIKKEAEVYANETKGSCVQGEVIPWLYGFYVNGDMGCMLLEDGGHGQKMNLKTLPWDQRMLVWNAYSILHSKFQVTQMDDDTSNILFKTGPHGIEVRLIDFDPRVSSTEHKCLWPSDKIPTPNQNILKDLDDEASCQEMHRLYIDLALSGC